MLTPKQARFVDELTVCGCAAEAARRAGYPMRSARQIGFENLTKHDIQQAIAVKKAAAARKIELKREHIIAGIFEAIETARTNGDPANLLKGWLSLAKITGLDQPEPKTPAVLSIQAEKIKKHFETMSLADLIAIAEGTHPEQIGVTTAPVRSRQ